MLATENETMNNVSQIPYKYNADDYIRDQCRAREKRLRKDRHHQEVIEKLALAQETIAVKDSTISEQAIALQEKDAEIARLQALLATSTINI